MSRCLITSPQPDACPVAEGTRHRVSSPNVVHPLPSERTHLAHGYIIGIPLIGGVCDHVTYGYHRLGVSLGQRSGSARQRRQHQLQQQSVYVGFLLNSHRIRARVRRMYGGSISRTLDSYYISLKKTQGVYEYGLQPSAACPPHLILIPRESQNRAFEVAAACAAVAQLRVIL